MLTTINLIPLPRKSSAIALAGYNHETRVLGLRFHGRTAPNFYTDVPQEVYDRLLAHASAGRYFHQAISGQYSPPSEAPPYDEPPVDTEHEGASPD